ncbi:MAG: multicopper oxidase domain-containing protein [Acidobacteriota bacterium]
MGRRSTDHEPSSPTVSRRRLLQGGLAGAAALTLPLWARNFVVRGGAAPAFTASPVAKTLADGSTIPTWQLVDAGGSGLGALPSALVVDEGDSVSLELTNGLAENVDLVVPGVTSGPPTWVTPGGSRTVTFTAPTAGTYLAHGITPLDPTGEVCRAMGLATPLVVRPPGEPRRLYSGGPRFDREYTLMYQDFDDRLNAAVDAGDSGSYDMANYEPNFFIVNGLGFPDTLQSGSTRLSMVVGDAVALRFLVAGQVTYPMHFHGYHADVEARREEGGLSAPETAVRSKDTVQVEIGASADVILNVDQPGVFPLHSHYVPAVTFDGIYLDPHGGSLLMLAANAFFADGFESGGTGDWSNTVG